MVQKMKLVFLFYRNFLVSSVLVNVLLLLFGIFLPVSIGIKTLFFCCLVIIYLTSKLKNKLIFYHNLSLSTRYLFAATFVFDLLLLFITYFIFGNVF